MVSFSSMSPGVTRVTRVADVNGDSSRMSRNGVRNVWRDFSHKHEHTRGVRRVAAWRYAGKPRSPSELAVDFLDSRHNAPMIGMKSLMVGMKSLMVDTQVCMRRGPWRRQWR